MSSDEGDGAEVTEADRERFRLVQERADRAVEQLGLGAGALPDRSDREDDERE